jgi:hypothetical protein
MTVTSSFPHCVTRLVFDTAALRAVPRPIRGCSTPAGEHRLGRSGGRHAGWPQIRADADEFGAHDFVLHCRGDMSPLMTSPSESTLSYVDSDDRTYFAVQQPSSVLASFGEPD